MKSYILNETELINIKIYLYLIMEHLEKKLKLAKLSQKFNFRDALFSIGLNL